MEGRTVGINLYAFVAIDLFILEVGDLVVNVPIVCGLAVENRIATIAEVRHVLVEVRIVRANARDGKGVVVTDSSELLGSKEAIVSERLIFVAVVCGFVSFALLGVESVRIA